MFIWMFSLYQPSSTISRNESKLRKSNDGEMKMRGRKTELERRGEEERKRGGEVREEENRGGEEEGKKERGKGEERR